MFLVRKFVCDQWQRVGPIFNLRRATDYQSPKMLNLLHPHKLYTKSLAIDGESIQISRDR